MKQKIFSAGLAALLTLSMLFGCTREQPQEETENKPSGATVTASEGDYTGGPEWGKPASKMAVNFDGRVASVEDGKVTLEDGTVVLTGDAEISAPDGSAAEIAVGDNIQGYAEDPDAAELDASSILLKEPI